jgi:hypothetical protein
MKTAETVRKVPDTCILKMVTSSYVIQWREEMYNVATERFREVGTYFYLTSLLSIHSLMRGSVIPSTLSLRMNPSKETMKMTMKRTATSTRTSVKW